MKQAVILSVAEKLGKTPAQVALRWGLQMGHSILPKSTSESRIKENFDVFDWSIPQDLLTKISSEIEQVQIHTKTSTTCSVLSCPVNNMILFYFLQARLLRGTSFVDGIYGSYKTLEELWDGEL